MDINSSAHGFQGLALLAAAALSGANLFDMVEEPKACLAVFLEREKGIHTFTKPSTEHSNV